MKNLTRFIFNSGNHDTCASIGLLLLRLMAGGSMLLAHGWGKLVGFAQLKSQFPSVLGLGSTVSLGLAVFAEVVCALLLVLGLLTRAAAVPLLITMLVAFLLIHGSDPFKVKELALFYAAAYSTLFFTGAGRFSLDGALFGKAS